MGHPSCGHKELKRPPETSAGTARDYSTTFGGACKDCGHKPLAILLSQRAGKREEEKPGAKKKVARKMEEDRPLAKKAGADEGSHLVRGWRRRPNCGLRLLRVISP
jgi:hypothetical protein